MSIATNRLTRGRMPAGSDRDAAGGSRGRGALGAALLLAALAAAARARAEGRTVLSADLYGRLNPSGVTLDLEAARRWDVPDGEGPLLRGRSFAAGGLLSANP